MDRHAAAPQTLFTQAAKRVDAQSRLFVTAPGILVALAKNSASHL